MSHMKQGIRSREDKIEKKTRRLAHSLKGERKTQEEQN